LVEAAKAVAFARPEGKELERRAYDDTALVFLRGWIREKGA
jgi:hypothetical protein